MGVTVPPRTLHTHGRPSPITSQPTRVCPQPQGWASYSPVKNSVAEAQAKAAESNPTHSLTAAELDMYKCTAMQLRDVCGAAIGNAQPVAFHGMPMQLYPAVSLSPSFAVTLSECKVSSPERQSKACAATVFEVRASPR